MKTKIITLLRSILVASTLSALALSPALGQFNPNNELNKIKTYKTYLESDFMTTLISEIKDKQDAYFAQAYLNKVKETLDQMVNFFNQSNATGYNNQLSLFKTHRDNLSNLLKSRLTQPLLDSADDMFDRLVNEVKDIDISTLSNEYQPHYTNYINYLETQASETKSTIRTNTQAIHDALDSLSKYEIPSVDPAALKRKHDLIVKSNADFLTLKATTENNVIYLLNNPPSPTGNTPQQNLGATKYRQYDEHLRAYQQSLQPLAVQIQFIRDQGLIDTIAANTYAQQMEAQRTTLLKVLNDLDAKLRDHLSREAIIPDYIHSTNTINNHIKHFWKNIETYIARPLFIKYEADLDKIIQSMKSIDTSKYPQSKALLDSAIQNVISVSKSAKLAISNYKDYYVNFLLPKLKTSELTQSDFQNYIQRNLGNQLQAFTAQIQQNVNTINTIINAPQQPALTPTMPTVNRTPPTIPTQTPPRTVPSTTRPGTTETGTLRTYFGPERRTAPPARKSVRWSWERDGRGNYYFYVNGQEVDYETFRRAGGKIRR